MKVIFDKNLEIKDTVKREIEREIVNNHKYLAENSEDQLVGENFIIEGIKNNNTFKVTLIHRWK